MDNLGQLLEQCRRRDMDAFEAVVNHFKKGVHALAWHMLHDRAEAEDVTQEAFLQVYMHLDTLSDVRAFRNWLFRIAARLCLARLKRRPPVWWPHPAGREDSELQAVLLRDSLARALNSLSPEHRAAVLLRDLYDHSYEDCADMLGIPLGTVKSRINTARARLRADLQLWKGDEVLCPSAN